MHLNFRTAVSEDINEVLRMIDEFNAIDQYAFDKEQGFKNLAHLLGHPDLGKIWVLILKEKIIGYVVLAFGFSFEYGGRDAFIDELFIKAPYRNKGFGEKTIDFLTDQAKLLGVNAIHLEVETHNEGGNKLYTKKGFEGNNRKLLTKRITE